MTPWNPFHVHEYLATELRSLLNGVFPQVTIRGMFGTPTLYETEIRRVDGARQRIRRKEQAAARQVAARQAADAKVAAAPRADRAARPLPVRVVRAVLPAFARAWLRSIVRPGANRAGRPASTAAVEPTPAADAAPAVEPPLMDLETFLQFSVADLFYADTDLDRAMDLLAICELEPRPPAR